jgi:hypothetical protein
MILLEHHTHLIDPDDLLGQLPPKGKHPRPDTKILKIGQMLKN